MSYPSTMRSHRSNTPSLESGFRTTTSSRVAAQQTALRGSSIGPSKVPQRSLPSSTDYKWSTDYRTRQQALPIGGYSTREVESVLREQREMNTRVQLAQRERERELATLKNYPYDRIQRGPQPRPLLSPAPPNSVVQQQVRNTDGIYMPDYNPSRYAEEDDNEFSGTHKLSDVAVNSDRALTSSRSRMEMADTMMRNERLPNHKATVAERPMRSSPQINSLLPPSSTARYTTPTSSYTSTYAANSIYGQGYTRPTATSTSMTPRAPSTTNQLSAAKTTPVSLESQRQISTYTSANTRIPSPQAPSASQQAAVSSTDHPEPPQGFRNMGNTCYQNASMQALLAVPHLIEDIEEHYGSASTALEASLSSSGHRISATRMSTSVAKDIVELAKRITASSLCLSALKSKCTERNDVFTGSRQNDAHEYIRVLLLLLHENVNRIRGKPAYQEMKDVPGEDPAEAARRWWNYHHTRDNSLVYDIFGGQQQSVVECRACGHQSWSFDPVLDLVLSMPSSRISSPQISLLLQWYTGLSKLEGADRYYCAKCKKPQEADRQVTIARWPAVLSLSLARFDRYGRKNSEEVTFDEVLLTAADCSADRRQRQYELFSVVIHTGTTDYGHYYAYVKKAGKWYRCDDSSVREVNFSMVRSEGRGAYILFYRKVRPS